MGPFLMELPFSSKKNPSSPSAAIFKRVLAVRKQSEELKSDHTQYMLIALSVQYHQRFFELHLEHV